MTAATANATRKDIGLEIVRDFEAPVSLVFKVWSTPEHMLRWWGPRDFTPHSVTMDFRPGGAWRACIRSPEGQDYWMSGVYREVREPEKLVFTFAWDEDGEPGADTLVTVSFADIGGRTRLTFQQTPFETVEERDSHQEGWGECLERLKDYLEHV
ncbi:SRPBCC domain-containing protein [Ensifer sp. ENS12]|uniref:SRPBCC domain-containing protein n=1 Tax=Ensifer sp. ENS12 TaxID=2854774 RepID=UPI000DE5987D|nr:SRPBCC domain-containing protein [Ensifer sp. ENS12]MBV7517607.1 SRPBCC domain-containing protein [Ensifer sp. ENS12]